MMSHTHAHTVLWGPRYPSLSVSWKAEKWDRATELCNSTNEHALIRVCVCVCVCVHAHTHNPNWYISMILENMYIRSSVDWNKQEVNHSFERGKVAVCLCPRASANCFTRPPVSSCQKLSGWNLLTPHPFKAALLFELSVSPINCEELQVTPAEGPHWNRTIRFPLSLCASPYPSMLL